MQATDWWAGPHRGRADGVLALPAPRQPRARRARAATRPGRRSSRSTTARTCCGPSRARPTARPTAARACAGATGATTATCGCSCSTRAADGCSRPVTARWSTTAEWEWIVEQTKDCASHLLLASSLPVLLPPAVHGLEAWNEAVCDGAWGRRWARWGEKVRQARRPRALGGVPRLVRAADGPRGRRRRRAGAVRRRRASRSSAATCTSPTWPRRASPRRGR